MLCKLYTEQRRKENVLSVFPLDNKTTVGHMDAIEKGMKNLGYLSDS
jgi:hypothetical protein